MVYVAANKTDLNQFAHQLEDLTGEKIETLLKPIKQSKHNSEVNEEIKIATTIQECTCKTADTSSKTFKSIKSINKKEQNEEEKEINEIMNLLSITPNYFENNNDIINLFSSDYMHQKLQPHILYWKKLEEFPLVSKYNLREVVDKDLKCNEDTKIIFLIFNPAAFLRTSVIENSFKPDIHYEAVKNLICYYLKILMMHNKINCQIFIANYPRLPNKKDYSLPLSPLDKKKSSLQIREIPLLTHELYTTLLKVSDLIITESNWHPALISSVMLEVPSIVIGSNVAIKEEKGVKKIVSDYTDMDMYVYQTLESLLKHNPASIFPYVSYPHEITFLPNINMVQNGYFYHITDIFNDERTISLFSELLLNKDYQSDLQTLFSSIKDRNKEALLAEKIVEIVIYD